MQGFQYFILLTGLRYPLYILLGVISFFVLLGHGFSEVPWASALTASVTVGCLVMVAKGYSAPINVIVGVVLIVAIETLTWLAVWRYGFAAGFFAWGVAHLAALVTSQVLMMGAAGAALVADSEEEVAVWIASRGFVFAVASVIGVIALAP